VGFADGKTERFYTRCVEFILVDSVSEME